MLWAKAKRFIRYASAYMHMPSMPLSMFHERVFGNNNKKNLSLSLFLSSAVCIDPLSQLYRFNWNIGYFPEHDENMYSHHEAVRMDWFENANVCCFCYIQCSAASIDVNLCRFFPAHTVSICANDFFLLLLSLMKTWAAKCVSESDVWSISIFKSSICLGKPNASMCNVCVSVCVLIDCNHWTRVCSTLLGSVPSRFLIAIKYYCFGPKWSTCIESSAAMKEMCRD